jgi:hypothetical protein
MAETAGPLGGSIDWKYYLAVALELLRLSRARLKDAQFPTKGQPPTRACRARRRSAASSTVRRTRPQCSRLQSNVRSGAIHVDEGREKSLTVRTGAHLAEEALETGLLKPLGRGCEALRTNGARDAGRGSTRTIGIYVGRLAQRGQDGECRCTEILMHLWTIIRYRCVVGKHETHRWRCCSAGPRGRRRLESCPRSSRLVYCQHIPDGYTVGDGLHAPVQLVPSAKINCVAPMLRMPVIAACMSPATTVASMPLGSFMRSYFAS